MKNKKIENQTKYSHTSIESYRAHKKRLLNSIEQNVHLIAQALAQNAQMTAVCLVAVYRNADDAPLHSFFIFFLPLPLPAIHGFGILALYARNCIFRLRFNCASMREIACDYDKSTQYSIYCV